MAFKFTQTGAEIQAILDNAASQTDVQSAIYASMITDTASGSIASFADGAAVPVADMTVNIDYSAAGWTGANIYVRGFNLWDEEWEVGSYNADGTEYPSTARIRTKNYIPVTPSTTYYFHTNGATADVHYYDKSKAHISLGQKTDATFTTPNNCYFVRFCMSVAYGTTYGDNLSINYPSTETAFYAFVGQDYAVSFGRTIYGGTLNPVTGKLISNKAADGTDITPVVYDIVPVAVVANYGQNNIFADCGNVSVDYRADTKLYIAKVV